MNNPEGWKLVPVEPTPEMLSAAFNATREDQIDWMRKHYLAMLDAAPTPSVDAPALRLPEPMTDLEIDAALVWHEAHSDYDIARAIEAEVIKRVKECNE